MTRIQRTFTLHVLPDDTSGYRLDVRVATNGATASVARLVDRQLVRLRTAIATAVTASKHPRTVVSPTRKAPIPLSEDAGVKLALTVLATAPLSKASRVEAIRIGIDAMTSEEALYWYAYCTGPDASRALRALRTLLG